MSHAFSNATSVCKLYADKLLKEIGYKLLRVLLPPVGIL